MNNCPTLAGPERQAKRALSRFKRTTMTRILIKSKRHKKSSGEKSVKRSTMRWISVCKASSASWTSLSFKTTMLRMFHSANVFARDDSTRHDQVVSILIHFKRSKGPAACKLPVLVWSKHILWLFLLLISKALIYALFLFKYFSLRENLIFNF